MRTRAAANADAVASDRRDRPEAMPVRLAALAGAFAIALSSCSDDGPVGAATQRNAVAAYVALDDDHGVAVDLSHALTRARDNEPSSPAGFIQGLRSSSRVRAETGITGTRLIFQANATEADRVLLAAHARETRARRADLAWPRRPLARLRRRAGLRQGRRQRVAPLINVSPGGAREVLRYLAATRVATLGLRAGSHPKVMSRTPRPRHVGVTLDLYCHVAPALYRDAADAVASLIDFEPNSSAGTAEEAGAVSS